MALSNFGWSDQIAEDQEWAVARPAVPPDPVSSSGGPGASAYRGHEAEPPVGVPVINSATRRMGHPNRLQQSISGIFLCFLGLLSFLLASLF